MNNARDESRSKILVLGDVHGHFDRLNHLIAQEQPDMILQCGDFGYWPQLGENAWKALDTARTPIYFCDGNIDDIASLQSLHGGRRQPVEISPGLFYMPRGSLLALEDGRQVLFVGGAMSRDKHQRTPGVDWYPEEVICSQDVCGLPEEAVDIVISHTCPVEFTVADYKATVAREEDVSRHYLSQVLARYHPQQWFFGHWHLRADGIYENTRWHCLGWQKALRDWFMILPGI